MEEAGEPRCGCDLVVVEETEDSAEVVMVCCEFVDVSVSGIGIYEQQN
jgi:hypothetical protein